MKSRGEIVKGGEKWAIATGPRLDRADFPFGTISELLPAIAEKCGDIGIVHLDADGKETVQSYEELAIGAGRAGCALAELGVRPGDPVIIDIWSHEKFYIAFWGCLGIKAIPVPVSPPESYEEGSPGFERMRSIWEKLERARLLTDASAYERYRAAHSLGEDTSRCLVALEQLLSGSRSAQLTTDPKDLALLQFSSGSTGHPKGVVLTHENLLANTLAIVRAFDPLLQRQPDSYSICSWLPHYHDMGLIGMHLSAMAAAAMGLPVSQIQLTPDVFVTRPGEYLRAIERHRVRISASPNFGFSWMTARVSDDELEQLDLSSLDILLNGAEPISSRVVNRFLERFRLAGFRPEAMIPVYGLAEASLAVTFAPLYSLPLRHRVGRKALTTEGIVRDPEGEEAVAELFDEGFPLSEMEVRVVGEEGQLLREDHVGEIEIRGRSVTSGYYCEPEINQRLYHDGWLRTGDRGFMRNGRLSVVGRIKGVICVRGQKHHAEDLEDVIGEALELPPGLVAAIGCPDERRGEEVLVVFVRHKRSVSEFMPLYRRIAQAVSRRFGLQIAHAIPIATMPRTSSGKLQRYMLRTGWERGDFEAVVQEVEAELRRQFLLGSHEVSNAPETPTQERLHAVWCDVLGLDAIGTEDNFFDLGGDSLSASILIHAIHRGFGVDLPLRTLFERPSIRELSLEIDAAGESAFRNIPQLPESEYYEPSSAQKRLMALHSIEGGTRYNLPQAMVVEGPLDVGRLEAAIGEMVRHHEILRTGFEFRDGRAVQRVHAPEEMAHRIKRIDGAGQSIETILTQFVRPFQLAQPPLFRVGVATVSEAEQFLLFDFHHIIVDGVSQGILFRELANRYAGTEVSPPAIQYRDYAAWQAEWLSSPAAEAQRAYWKEQLRGELPVLALPTDRRRPSRQTFEAKETSFALDEELSRQLKRIAAANHATLFMTLLAAYAVSLRAFTRQEEFIIGCPVTGREHADLENLVGMFVNQIPLRLSLDSEETFRELLARVRETCLGALENAAYPFDEMVRDLGFPRELSRKPVFDTVFALQNLELPDVDLEGTRLRPCQIANRNAHFDVTVQAYDRGEQIEFLLDYNESLFRPATIRSLCSGIVEVVRQAIEDVEIPVGRMRLVSTSDVARLIQTSRAPAAAQSRHRTLVEACEAMAREAPDRPAVRCEEHHLTYAELHAASKHLAGRLREHGIQSGAVVGLLMPRSVKAIVGILGILKAGGAYLPLDPNLPDRRLAALLGDGGCRVLVSTLEFQARFLPGLGSTTRPGRPVASPPGREREWVLLDDLVLDSHSSESNWRSSGERETPAYVIYTSGSTGSPKGVVVDHGSVLHLVAGLEERVYREFEGALRIGLLAPLAFDASVQQIFASLLLGHELVIAPASVRIDPRRLAAWFTDNAIDISDATPSHLAMLAGALPRHSPPLGVQHFLVGGEALGCDMVDSFFSRFDDYRPAITNVYGLTECGVDSTSHRIVPDAARWGECYPIGRPLPGVAVYVLDENGLPVPTGVIGDVSIGGRGVAQGYLNRADLSEERFLPSPYLPDEIVFKTGDLARRLPDGSLEFAGRRDEQMKIRGYRIEPGEIEHHLRRIGAQGQEAIDNAGAESFAFGAISGSFEHRRCTRCVLSGSSPNIRFDDNGLCSVCEEFETYRDVAAAYFGKEEEFRSLVEKTRSASRADHDCLLLFSGGKDSSYVLYRLVDMGLRVHTFTFDNGYISQNAFENIERMTASLGVDHVTLGAHNMRKIFAESLAIDHTVCSGCFRALTSVSTQFAESRGINMVITGLSRGQIFDTKLRGLLKLGVHTREAIEQELSAYRKIYHARRDSIAGLLDVDLVGSPRLDAIEFVDYFRFDSVTTADIKAYLGRRDEYWSQPRDTGFCSTNCRINDAGTFAHQRRRGYHNYEAPLSWEVRLGVTTREAALAQVEAPLDEEGARKIFEEIGYTLEPVPSRISQAAVVEKTDGSKKYLCAYVVADRPISPAVLRDQLRKELPDYMIPARFVALEQMPMNSSGKIDRRVLRDMLLEQPATAERRELPRNESETQILEIWKEVLELDEIGVTEDFFDLGGESLEATLMVAMIEDQFGVEVALSEVIDEMSVRALACHVEGLQDPQGA